MLITFFVLLFLLWKQRHFVIFISFGTIFFVEFSLIRHLSRTSTTHLRTYSKRTRRTPAVYSQGFGLSFLPVQAFVEKYFILPKSKKFATWRFRVLLSFSDAPAMNGAFHSLPVVFAVIKTVKTLNYVFIFDLVYLCLLWTLAWTLSRPRVDARSSWTDFSPCIWNFCSQLNLILIFLESTQVNNSIRRSLTCSLWSVPEAE